MLYSNVPLSGPHGWLKTAVRYYKQCGSELIVTVWPGELGMDLECPKGCFRESRSWGGSPSTKRV